MHTHAPMSMSRVSVQRASRVPYARSRHAYAASKMSFTVGPHVRAMSAARSLINEVLRPSLL